MIDPWDCEDPDHEGSGVRGDRATACEDCLLAEEDAADDMAFEAMRDARWE